MEPLLSTQSYLKEKYKKSKEKRIAEALATLDETSDDAKAYEKKRKELQQSVEGDLE